MHDAADEISPDDFDDIHYPRPGEATDFEKLVDKMISRRGFLAVREPSSPRRRS